MLYDMKKSHSIYVDLEVRLNLLSVKYWLYNCQKIMHTKLKFFSIPSRYQLPFELKLHSELDLFASEHSTAKSSEM